MTTAAPVNRFIQIPSAGPILTPGGNDEWDGHIIEVCNVIKDNNTYYLYYHGSGKWGSKWAPGKTSQYRLGVATASHPMGPWKKYEGNPILELGPEKSWDDFHVACAAVLKEKDDRYYMWYSAYSRHLDHEGPHHKWGIGLATASNPLGPWTRHAANPVLEDFGYVGSVVKVNGQYRMFNEYPIGLNSPDQGPLCLATADKPEGPWKKYECNPVLTPGELGAWDDGGYSEAAVLHQGGLYQVFYSGTKWKKLETIGYAWSEDGIRFTKHPLNPVVLRERVVDCSAMAEIHAFLEYPVFYLFHTARYFSKPEFSYEDIAVQAVAVATPFSVRMPVALPATLAAGIVTDLAACPPIGLEQIGRATITLECRYHERATAGLRVHVRSSADGMDYDTADRATAELPCAPGAVARKTMAIPPGVAFVKLALENMDGKQAVEGIRVTAVLGAGD